MSSSYTHISSDKSLRHIKKRPEYLKQILYSKPNGFWYEVDGDWRRWCSSEQPNWLADHFLYKIIFGKEKILKINSEADLELFNKEYQYKDPSRLASLYSCNTYIDWPRICQEYDGIEIAPYFWKFRLEQEYFWYYSWDCASGCIWRPRGARIELLEGPIILPKCNKCSAPVASYEETDICWRCR